MSTSLAGSTLLGAMLGSHSEAAFLGEPALILRQGEKGGWRHRKFCSVCALQQRESCPVWSKGAINALRTNPDDVYALSIARYGARRVLVDASKDPAWMRAGRRRARDVRCIHIVKSVHAYMASALTSQSHSSAIVPELLAANWARDNLAIESLAKEMRIPYEMVRYEDLATKPYETLQRLARFSGLEAEPEQLNFWQHEHHFVKSNPGLVTQLERASGFPPPMVQPRDKNLIELDEKWKRLLDRSLLHRMYAIRSVRRATEHFGLEMPDIGEAPLHSKLRARVLVRAARAAAASARQIRRFLPKKSR